MGRPFLICSTGLERMGVGDLESDQLPNMFSAVTEGESWGNGLGHED